MIERLIKNQLTLKRWRIFKSRRISWYSCWVFLFFLFISVSAEFWSNNKPIILSYKGSLYSPILKDYAPEDLGLEIRQHTIRYKTLALGEKDWALWPLVRWSPYESNLEVSHFPSPPSRSNLLGTDDRGRDVLSRLIYGYRYSMIFALSVWLFSYLLGTLMGALMGYFGGLTDLVGQRFVEILESIPFLIVLITITTVLGRSLTLMIVYFSLTTWVAISFYMRAEFLRLRKRSFIEASRAQGESQLGIIVKHIIPNALNPIITFSPFALAGLIGTLTILDYLGFGLVPPTPSWGELLSQSEKYITVAWWLVTYPSLALFSTLLSLTFIGNGVRDAFDPKEV